MPVFQVTLSAIFATTNTPKQTRASKSYFRFFFIEKFLVGWV